MGAMPRLALSKTSLTREVKQLGTYERFLPSLDLKRRQLLAARNQARRELAATRQRISEVQASCGPAIPMAADKRLDLTGLVIVEAVETDAENVVGLQLPVLRNVEMRRAEYSFLVRPYWVDVLADILENLMVLRVEAQIQERRLEILEMTAKKVTQRVNLFDKVLIPRARENIRRIRIYLSDADKAAVVNAKIAKRKRAHQ